MEKSVLGFYVSGHPLDTWQKICEEWLGWSTDRIKQMAAEKAAAPPPAAPQGNADWGGGGGGGYQRFRAPKTEIKIGGLLGEIREVMTKKGSRMAFGVIEDLRGKVEIVLFPEAYQQVGDLVRKAAAEAEPVLLTGEIEFGEEAPKILLKSLEDLAEAHRGRVQQVVLKLNPSEITPDQLRELKKGLLAHRGKCPVRIDFLDPAFRTRLDLPRTVAVAATPQLVQTVQRIFGREDVISLN